MVSLLWSVVSWLLAGAITQKVSRASSHDSSYSVPKSPSVLAYFMPWFASHLLIYHCPKKVTSPSSGSRAGEINAVFWLTGSNMLRGTVVGNRSIGVWPVNNLPGNFC